LINLVWEDWLTAIAPSLNVTASQAGVIMSFLIIVVAIIMVAGASPVYAEKTIPIVAFLGCLFFTYIQWLPVWTGTALSFVMAIFSAMAIRAGFK
jgi:hypothetical protein